MKIPHRYNQFLEQRALIIVSAKDHGVIYRLSDGRIEEIEHLEEHQPTYSDNEGFFFKAAPGQTVIGGAPKESDEELYKDRLDKTVAHELDALIKTDSATLLYVFEPKQYKGHIVNKLKKHPHLRVHTVRYGNYVKEPPLTLIKYIDEFISAHQVKVDDEEIFDADLKRHT